ncbi:hypothetical protein [Spirillospora sp. NPDC047279]|uniref:hypothetical protein n=1 Tax=Spirillospora sp. NPDC047279 TaxID=3155478 RepID=UPI0033F8FEDB
MPALPDDRAAIAAAASKVSALLAGTRARVALGAVLLAGTLVIFIVPSSDDEAARLTEGRLTPAAAAADRVPPAPGEPPSGCGLTKATLEALVPGADRSLEGCTWSSLDDREPGSRRSLRVTQDEGFPRGMPVSSTSDALYALSPDPPERLGGLGDDEALARYTVEGGEGVGEIVFSHRGSLVTVAYKGLDHRFADDSEPLAEKPARAGALRAAVEVARRLGTRASPGPAAPPAATPPVRSVPKPCDSVPRGTLDKVAKGAVRSRGQSTLLSTTFGAAVDSCVWTAGTPADLPEPETRRWRWLQVTIARVPDREPGGGTAAAARAYLFLHRTARGDFPMTAVREVRPFRALAGPGDQAFGGVWSQNDAHGRVVFRIRNVVAEVRYSGEDEPPGNALARDIPEDTALDGAYTVALAVAGGIR